MPIHVRTPTSGHQRIGALAMSINGGGGGDEVHFGDIPLTDACGSGDCPRSESTGNDTESVRLTFSIRAILDSDTIAGLNRQTLTNYAPPDHPSADQAINQMRFKSSVQLRSGHFYQNRVRAKNNKKPRSSFNKKQVAVLEAQFMVQKYLASSERTFLAKQLNMSDSQVKTWFQNRRTKLRREEAEEKESERCDRHHQHTTMKYPTSFFARPDIIA